MDEDQAYRAMDLLVEADAQAEVQEAVFFAVADLLNLEVDLLFFDTTSTYFERDTAETGDDAFRVHGHSKDHRDDLPQIVIGLAVTKEGIPVRVWCWPGNASDQALIRQVKDDLRDWTLARVIWVADRGFASAANRRYLRRGDHHYIIGERLRSGSAEATAALSRQGRYQQVADNLRVKEVRIADAERFVICYNPEQADRDAAVRTRLLAQLQETIAGTDKLSVTKRAELRGVLSTKPGLARFLRVTPGGLLRVDQHAVKTEQGLDGKYLLRCSDPHLSAEDVALGYKQLLAVERGWRDLKQVIDLRPVYHRKEERIRAHVLLCWLALLLTRTVETSCGEGWPSLRRELERIKLGTFAGPAGTFRQRTEVTTSQRAILAKLDLPEPPRVWQLTPATPNS
jgi:transposase